ncbi:MAG: hypothetical protein ABIH20_03650 [Candidatus Diapherotrites archaeon]
MKIPFPKISEIQSLADLKESDQEFTDREIWLLSEFGGGSK